MQTSGPGLTEFELRGLSSSGGNSPTVGFYLNDRDTRFLGGFEAPVTEGDEITVVIAVAGG